MIESKNSTENCFDFLRFFFAFEVLLAHLAELSNNPSLSFLLNFTNSSIGVKGFFVISGFLVTKSYINTNNLKKYFIKRAKRILPAYLFVVFFSALILSFFSSFSFTDYFSNINLYQYIAWNSVFLNFMHPCLPGLFENNILCAVNGALWTLKVEEGFYIVLPILIYLFFKTKQKALLLLTVYFSSILYWYLLTKHFNIPVLAKQLPGYLCYFVVGIAAYLYYDLLFKYFQILLVCSIILFSIQQFLYVDTYIFYPVSFGVIVLIAAFKLSFFNKFGKFGDFTYGLYIYHFPIIQIFKQYDLFEKYNPYLMGFLVIIISFTFAIFSWFIIEKRFLERYQTKNH